MKSHRTRYLSLFAALALFLFFMTPARAQAPFPPSAMTAAQWTALATQCHWSTTVKNDLIAQWQNGSFQTITNSVMASASALPTTFPGAANKVGQVFWYSMAAYISACQNDPGYVALQDNPIAQSYSDFQAGTHGATQIILQRFYPMFDNSNYTWGAWAKAGFWLNGAGQLFQDVWGAGHRWDSTANTSDKCVDDYGWTVAGVIPGWIPGGTQLDPQYALRCVSHVNSGAGYQAIAYNTWPTRYSCPTTPPPSAPTWGTDSNEGTNLCPGVGNYGEGNTTINYVTSTDSRIMGQKAIELAERADYVHAAQYLNRMGAIRDFTRHGQPNAHVDPSNLGIYAVRDSMFFRIALKKMKQGGHLADVTNYQAIINDIDLQTLNVVDDVVNGGVWSITCTTVNGTSCRTGPNTIPVANSAKQSMELTPLVLLAYGY